MYTIFVVLQKVKTTDVLFFWILQGACDLVSLAIVSYGFCPGQELTNSAVQFNLYLSFGENYRKRFSITDEIWEIHGTHEIFSKDCW